MLTLINFEKWKSKNKNADFYKISFLKEEAELRAVYFRSSLLGGKKKDNSDHSDLDLQRAINIFFRWIWHCIVVEQTPFQTHRFFTIRILKLKYNFVAFVDLLRRLAWHCLRLAQRKML